MSNVRCPVHKTWHDDFHGVSYCRKCEDADWAWARQSVVAVWSETVGAAPRDEKSKLINWRNGKGYA